MKNPGLNNHSDLLQQRDANIKNQRQQNVWMGRDNEFRNYRRAEQAVVDVKDLKNQISSYSQAAGKLRQHNFKFGFDKTAPNPETLHRTAAMKKSLYEYTKASNDTNFEWRNQQIVRNRASNIQWGLKREDAQPNERYAGKSLHLNATQSISSAGPHMKTLESTRTAKNMSDYRISEGN